MSQLLARSRSVPRCSKWSGIGNAADPRRLLAGPPPITHSGPAARLPERMRLTLFSRQTRPTVSVQSVGNLWSPTASDIEGPTDLDWVGLCFETEISRCALDSCMTQKRSNRLQIASAFQNVESLRSA